MLFLSIIVSLFYFIFPLHTTVYRNVSPISTFYIMELCKGRRILSIVSCIAGNILVPCFNRRQIPVILAPYFFAQT